MYTECAYVYDGWLCILSWSLCRHLHKEEVALPVYVCLWQPHVAGVTAGSDVCVSLLVVLYGENIHSLVSWCIDGYGVSLVCVVGCVVDDASVEEWRDLGRTESVVVVVDAQLPPELVLPAGVEVEEESDALAEGGLVRIVGRCSVFPVYVFKSACLDAHHRRAFCVGGRWREAVCAGESLYVFDEGLRIEFLRQRLDRGRLLRDVVDRECEMSVFVFVLEDGVLCVGIAELVGGCAECSYFFVIVHELVDDGVGERVGDVHCPVEDVVGAEPRATLRVDVFVHIVQGDVFADAVFECEEGCVVDGEIDVERCVVWIAGSLASFRMERDEL